MPTALSFILMVVLPLLASSCAVPIKDDTFCARIPGGGLGAVCDNFLTANQRILDEQQWQLLQASWEAHGDSVECTTSSAVAALKAEIEKLCSVSTCTYEVQSLVQNFFSKLNSIQGKARAFQK